MRARDASIAAPPLCARPAVGLRPPASRLPLLRARPLRLARVMPVSFLGDRRWSFRR